MNPSSGHRIGFVGTRFHGTDGVSLEASKWAKVLWDHRHVSYWFAGRLNTDPAVSMLVPHAFFGNPDIEWINRRIFSKTSRDPAAWAMSLCKSNYCYFVLRAKCLCTFNIIMVSSCQSQIMIIIIVTRYKLVCPTSFGPTSHAAKA